jgi:hypothetical protein
VLSIKGGDRPLRASDLAIPALMPGTVVAVSARANAAAGAGYIACPPERSGYVAPTPLVRQGLVAPDKSMTLAVFRTPVLLDRDPKAAFWEARVRVLSN